MDHLCWGSISIPGRYRSFDLTFIPWVGTACMEDHDRSRISTSASLASRSSTLSHHHHAMLMHYVSYNHHCTLLFDAKMCQNGPQFRKLHMWKGPMSKCPVDKWITLANFRHFLGIYLKPTNVNWCRNNITWSHMGADRAVATKIKYPS